ncbi:hypothetical protein C8Q74DRAFT_804708 [Fomes fomentarius]|nr:hypothetical protein C8Q74DRAFT_804708 [Fomes fomentarius]
MYHTSLSAILVLLSLAFPVLLPRPGRPLRFASRAPLVIWFHVVLLGTVWSAHLTCRTLSVSASVPRPRELWLIGSTSKARQHFHSSPHPLCSSLTHFMPYHYHFHVALYNVMTSGRVRHRRFCCNWLARTSVSLAVFTLVPHRLGVCCAPSSFRTFRLLLDS